MRMERRTIGKGALALGATLAALWASAAGAVNVNFVSGATGNDIAVMQELVKPWEAETGNTVTFVPMPSSTTDQFAQYRLWLAAGNADIDVYMVDVIWAPQLSDQFLDLTEAAAEVIARPLPLDHRIADRRRQARGAAVLHRRAGALLPQGPAREVRRRGPDHLGRADGDRAEDHGRRARRGQDRPLGLRLAGRRLRGPDLQRARMGQVERRRADHRARRHDLGQQRQRGEGARDGQGLGRHHLAARRALLHGGGVAAASGRPATPSSCATGPTPTRSATATTARSRACSTWRRCRPAAATTRRRRRSAAGTSRSRATRRTRRRRSRWRCTWPRPSARSRFAIKTSHLPTIISLYDDADDRRGAAADPALEGHLPERGAAAVGADQGRLQRGLVEVLDGGARHAVAGPAPPRRTSSCSSSTSTR